MNIKEWSATRLFMVGVGLLFLSLPFCSEGWNKQNAESKVIADQVGRAGMCESVIKKQLKDPTSYQEMSTVHGISEKKPGFSAVRITYLAKNSFNAKVKGQYQCIFDQQNKLHLSGEL